jgi:hypothetical protein
MSIFFKSPSENLIVLEKELNVEGRLIPFCPIGATLPLLLTPLQFEEKFKASYLPTLAFETEAVLKRVKKECAKLVKINPFGVQAKWQGIELNRELTENRVKGVVIKWVDEAIGYGAFASRSFERGAFIGEYTGILHPYRFFYSSLNPYCFRYPTFNFFFNTFYVDAEKMGNETRFMNHSETPSCEPWAAYHNNLLHIIIKAKREIKEGEELTFCYYPNT